MKAQEYMQRMRKGETLMLYERGKIGYKLFSAIRRGDRVYPIIVTKIPGKDYRLDMYDANVMKYVLLSDAEMGEDIKPVSEYGWAFSNPDAAFTQMLEALASIDEEFEFLFGFRKDDFYVYSNGSFDGGL